VDRFHSVYHPYFHPLTTRPGPRSSQPWLEAVLAHCRARGFHFVSGADWVQFNDARRSLRLVDYRWDSKNGVLAFALQAEQAIAGVTLALPHTFRGRAMVRARLDGESVLVEPQQLEGRAQVLLPASYSAGQMRRWHIEWGLPGQ
jgi:hypothetical protein